MLPHSKTTPPSIPRKRNAPIHTHVDNPIKTHAYRPLGARTDRLFDRSTADAAPTATGRPICVQSINVSLNRPSSHTTGRSWAAAIHPRDTMASIEGEQSHLIFLPFAPFEPLNSGEELPLSVGRPVLLLNRDESPDWWFGRDVEDGREVRVCVWIECGC